jgi:hypothetical protein
MTQEGMAEGRWKISLRIRESGGPGQPRVPFVLPPGVGDDWLNPSGIVYSYIAIESENGIYSRKGAKAAKKFEYL